MTVDGLPENKRTKTYFTPEYLVEWAKAVKDCYENKGHIEVLFHKDAPMVARLVADEDENEPSIGIGIAPRLPAEDYE
jgi:hypothetical protein